MSNFDQRRKDKSDKYLPEQIRILAKIFQCKPEDFRISSLEEDYQGIDLWYGTLRISLRTRNRPIDDLTVRLSKDIFGNNELSKLKGKNMDYILEAEIDKHHEGKLSSWRLYDIEEMDEHIQNDFKRINHQELQGDNYHFLAIDADDLQKKCPTAIRAIGWTDAIETMDGHYQPIRRIDYRNPRDFYVSKLR